MDDTNPVGARLAREGIDSVYLMYRSDAFAGKPRSYSTGPAQV